ncbi:hypothetical protein TPHA_0D03950 [Tetrapisispora phaffii CBS 4417]|uniref:Cwf19-like C-terminal domain-containing protein n=1 Tax=Tetrapisispora phaffii (strain ATCC 24235 / CBS 4417 / NBRC 1672 / NRRL Y-8282 / UCD 70-5) TaxID=1071381 RepID=G8BT57_TETPH|nr:hypothetical protein TPHA_0D03950 [Tetrapisispora phaffii CBS 4417]CCE63028.1 hypothetical protein TPHA_0D03950 [Tetrapisispora phaffii CBS 4417]
MASIKVLVAHSNVQNIDDALAKLTKLNSKQGPFDALFMLGDLHNSIKEIHTDGLPPTFYPSYNDDVTNTSTDLENHVTLLNNFGIYQLATGLKVVYTPHNFKQLDDRKELILQKLEMFNEKVDILISHIGGSKHSKEAGRNSGSDIIDAILRKVEPKYHFSYNDQLKYYENAPFQWKKSGRITRCMNIPVFGSKEKWAYAVLIELDDNESAYEVPPNIGSNPFEESKQNKRGREAKYTTDIKVNPFTKETQMKKPKIVLPNQCHFCFTNPNIEDHMFISINKNSYLTTAKGPLSVPKDEMPFSGHCLIIPIKHIPKISQSKTQEELLELNKELNDYELSIARMNFIKYDMSTIVFEISSSTSFHFHKQVIPVPKYLIFNFSSALDRQLYFNNEKFKLNGNLNFKQYTVGSSEYNDIVNDKNIEYMQFKVYETSEEQPIVYLSTFLTGEKIDLQFGRRVIAYVLRYPKRIMWNSPTCQQTKEQEIEDVKKFQSGYKNYDISN